MSSKAFSDGFYLGILLEGDEQLHVAASGREYQSAGGQKVPQPPHFHNLTGFLKKNHHHMLPTSGGGGL
jgi:hypothetical protein